MSATIEYSLTSDSDIVISTNGESIWHAYLTAGKIIDNTQTATIQEDGSYVVSGTITFVDEEAKNAYIEEITPHIKRP